MLYLKASSGIEFLDEFNGEKGKFIKTFGLNDKRNKNGWRADWEGIKKNIPSFLDDGGRPGIEYVACDGTVCDLDHTDGTTKEISIDVQEDFRVTTIIDYTIDSETHTGFFIHKVLTDETWEKLQSGKLKFVSPSLWPKQGGFEIVGTMPNGLPKIDVWEWDGLHTAFVTNPAFGDEARVTAMCEGEGCHMRLLSAKQLKAETEDGLEPLRQIPILVKHKGQLRFVSVDKEVAEKLYASFQKDIAINEETLLQIISEHEKNKIPNTSFSACSCSGNQMTLSATEEKELRDAAKANEDKVKELESKLKGMTDDKEKLEAKLKASETNDDEKVKTAKKAAADSDEAAKKAKQAQEESDKENKDLKAKIAEPLIAKILEGAKPRLDDSQYKKLEASLKAKTIPELEEAIIMTSLSASEIPAKHFEFSDNNPPSALSAKSLEETFGEVEVKA